MTIYLKQLENTLSSLEENYNEITLGQAGVDYFKSILEKNKDKRIDRRILDDFNGYKMLCYEKDKHNRVSLCINDEPYYGAKQKELHITVCCEAKYSADWLHTLTIDETLNTWGDVLKVWAEKESKVSPIQKPDRATIENEYKEIESRVTELNALLDAFYLKHKIMLDK